LAGAGDLRREPLLQLVRHPDEYISSASTQVLASIPGIQNCLSCRRTWTMR
jgi:hypothetical protein